MSLDDHTRAAFQPGRVETSVCSETVSTGCLMSSFNDLAGQAEQILNSSAHYFRTRLAKTKRVQHRLRTLQRQQQFILVQQLFSQARLKGTLGNATNASGTGWLLGRVSVGINMWVSHFSPATPVWFFGCSGSRQVCGTPPMTTGVANLWLLMSACLYASVFCLGTLFLLWLWYSISLRSSSVCVWPQ